MVFFKTCAAVWNELDKTTMAHMWGSVSGEMGGKLLLP